MNIRNKILALVFFQILFSCISIEKDIEIVGIVTWDYWKKNAGWKDCEALNFYVDYSKLDILKEKLIKKNHSFIVFASAFCSDCEDEIPKVFRVFAETGIPTDRITLVGLDKNNTEPSGLYKKNDVKSVPAVIVFRDKIEIGRVYGTFKDIIENFTEILEGK